MPATEQYWTDPQGRRVCYAEYGDPAGRPLFYFHGWPSSRFQAAMFDAGAKRLHLRVIAPDRPGIGRSDYAGKRTLSQWPPVVAGLADHLGLDKFRVLGISGGGPYALACAAWLPHRVERATVVCCAPPLAEFSDLSDLLWLYRLMLQARRYAPWLMEKLIGLAGVMTYFSPTKPPMSWLYKTIPKVDREATLSSGGYEAYFGNLRESVRQGGRGPVADAEVYLGDWQLDFSKIEVPVTFWHGEDDKNIPLWMTREIAARIPAAKTHWLPHEGHYSLPLNQATAILEELAGD